MPQATPSRGPIQERVAAGAGEVAAFLRQEASGGKLLLAATAAALLWANLDAASYRAVWDARAAIGPASLHLDLTLAAWAAEGLLAIFFFVAGMELKRELAIGELTDRRTAALPVAAAVGGMLVPALVALAVSGGAAAEGGAWAIPVATDIAFALGVLALAGAALPSGARVLLLTIAIVDDLLAIILIAVVFTEGLSVAWLAAGCAAAALYWLSAHRGRYRPWLLLAIAIVVWVCIHASGVHATVAGILLGFLTPVRPRPDGERTVAARLEHRLHPVSAGVAVPVFALGAAGIALGAAGDAIHDTVALGAFAGLLLGKVVGIFGAARLVVALRLGSLPERVTWHDVLPLSMLGAIGYTVSLLIAGLAFDDAAAEERSAAAVLVASVIASAIAVLLLRRRSRAGTR